MSKIYAKYNRALEEIDALDPEDRLKANIVRNSNGVFADICQAKTPITQRNLKNWDQVEDVIFGTAWTPTTRLEFMTAKGKHLPKNTLAFISVGHNEREPLVRIPSVKFAAMIIFIQRAYQETIGTVHNEKLKNKLDKLNNQLAQKQHDEAKLKTAIKQTKQQIK